MRKPPQGRSRHVTVLAPAIIEKMRADLLARGRRRDATLLSVLGYAGLRPEEALALTWGHVRERTVLVERAVSDGVMKPTKNRKLRAVRLEAPVRADLAAWRLAAGRPDDSALAFPTASGEPWRESDWRIWRRRVFRPAALAAGVEGSRPYDLRHSAASLWLHEGRSVIEVADWLGHAPSMCLDTYGHVVRDLGDERVSAEQAIRAAREVCVRFVQASAPQHGR